MLLLDWSKHFKSVDFKDKQILNGLVIYHLVNTHIQNHLLFMQIINQQMRTLTAISRLLSIAMNAVNNTQWDTTEHN